MYDVTLRTTLTGILVTHDHLEQVDSSLSKNQALICKLNLLQLSYKHKIWILRKAYAINLL